VTTSITRDGPCPEPVITPSAQLCIRTVASGVYVWGFDSSSFGAHSAPPVPHHCTPYRDPCNVGLERSVARFARWAILIDLMAER
jgi:hypothetical protein